MEWSSYSEIAQIRFYFKNVQNRRWLDPMGQVKLAAAKGIVDKNGIIAELEDRLKLLPTYVRTQNKLTEKQARLKRINRLRTFMSVWLSGIILTIWLRNRKKLNGKITEKNKYGGLRLTVLFYRIFKNAIKNLLWAFFYNTIGIPFAAGLFYNPFSLILGALAMSFNSVFVMCNALRLWWFKPKHSSH